MRGVWFYRLDDIIIWPKRMSSRRRPTANPLRKRYSYNALVLVNSTEIYGRLTGSLEDIDREIMDNKKQLEDLIKQKQVSLIVPISRMIWLNLTEKRTLGTGWIARGEDPRDL